MLTGTWVISLHFMLIHMFDFNLNGYLDIFDCAELEIILYIDSKRAKV